MSTHKQKWTTNKKNYFSKCLLDEGRYSDLKILAGESSKEFKVHKAIVAEAPGIREDLAKLSNSSDPILHYPGIREEVMELLLKFMYTGELQNDKTPEDFENGVEHNILQLFEAASQFELDVLIEICAEMLEIQLVVDNALEVFQIAMNAGHKRLIKCSLDYICQYGHTLMEFANFETLKLSSVLEIIKQDSLCVYNELQVFLAVCKWGVAESHRRNLDSSDTAQLRTVLDKLIQWIRFPLMTHAEFKNYVMPKKLLGNDELGNLLIYFMTPANERSSLPEELFISSYRYRYFPTNNPTATGSFININIKERKNEGGFYKWECSRLLLPSASDEPNFRVLKEYLAEFHDYSICKQIIFKGRRLTLAYDWNKKLSEFGIGSGSVLVLNGELDRKDWTFCRCENCNCVCHCAKK